MTLSNQKWSLRFERTLLWFFPRRCVWCGNATEPEHILCPRCAASAPEPLPDIHLRHTDIPLVSVYTYHSRANRILLNFKFRDARSLAPSIGYAMGDAISHMLAQPSDWVFCCVPMTEQQQKKRSYNQSALLASAAARWVGADCDNTLLRKCRITQTQHNLPAAMRDQNVKDAYEIRDGDVISLIGSHGIVLCDDIATTGATLRACITALQAAGLKRIICLTYLRTETDASK